VVVVSGIEEAGKSTSLFLSFFPFLFSLLPFSLPSSDPSSPLPVDVGHVKYS